MKTDNSQRSRWNHSEGWSCWQEQDSRTKAPVSAHPILMLLLNFYLCSISPLAYFLSAPRSDFLSFLLWIELERIQMNKVDVARRSNRGNCECAVHCVERQYSVTRYNNVIFLNFNSVITSQLLFPITLSFLSASAMLAYFLTGSGGK